MSDIQSLINSVNKFRDERNWRQYHNPTDLAISISIEAAELLEDFEWISSEKALHKDKKNIREEVADVLIYSLMLCSDLDLDVKKIVKEKLEKNCEKYPV